MASEDLKNIVDSRMECICEIFMVLWQPQFSFTFIAKGSHTFFRKNKIKSSLVFHKRKRHEGVNTHRILHFEKAIPINFSLFLTQSCHKVHLCRFCGTLAKFSELNGLCPHSLIKSRVHTLINISFCVPQKNLTKLTLSIHWFIW